MRARRGSSILKQAPLEGITAACPQRFAPFVSASPGTARAPVPHRARSITAADTPLLEGLVARDVPEGHPLGTYAAF